MLINLTKSVPLRELCKISVIGHTTMAAHSLEITFSHAAIVGFATELLWMYEDINEHKKLNLCTHQLQVDPAPNQILGFYLTPSSPMLMLKVNSLKDSRCEYRNWKEIYIEAKNTNQYYDVREPSVGKDGKMILETYELSRKNIINISVFNREKNDITQYYDTVIFEINYMGLKELGTMLLVWANNAKEGDEYLISRIDESICGYNLGVVLTKDSVSTIFKCHDLGNAYDYDSRL